MPQVVIWRTHADKNTEGTARQCARMDMATHRQPRVHTHVVHTLGVHAYMDTDTLPHRCQVCTQL